MSAFPARLERLRSRSLAPLLLLSASFGPGAALAEDAEAPVTLPPVTVTGERPASAGLALDVPNSGGSRLGLTPLETPASVEGISGPPIRDRGRTTGAEAGPPNATGLPPLAAP
ncbi:TonB-dependent siderophore receptor, partial [Azospirillum brasilense]|nr:TonB-dependent siderophore receptor [Azospirillum brasilense]